jgi:hypothetical protein
MSSSVSNTRSGAAETATTRSGSQWIWYGVPERGLRCLNCYSETRHAAWRPGSSGFLTIKRARRRVRCQPSSRSTHQAKHRSFPSHVSQQYFGTHPHESFCALACVGKSSQGRASQFNPLQVSSSPHPSAARRQKTSDSCFIGRDLIPAARLRVKPYRTCRGSSRSGQVLRIF